MRSETSTRRGEYRKNLECRLTELRPFQGWEKYNYRGHTNHACSGHQTCGAMDERNHAGEETSTEVSRNCKGLIKSTNITLASV